MGGDDFDPVLDGQSRGVRIDDVGRQAACTGCFAGPREDHIVVGDAAIGDPGLHAVDPHMVVTVRPRRRPHRRHIGTRFRLREREGRDGLSAHDRREVALLDVVGGEQGNRAGSEALHGESKIRKAVVIGQGLANEAKHAHVVGRREAAIGLGNARPQPSGLAEPADQLAA